MLRIGSHRVALLGSVVAMIPVGPGWLISVWPGIVTLMALVRPDVQAAFDIKKTQPETPGRDTTEDASDSSVERVRQRLWIPALGLLLTGVLGALTGIHMMALGTPLPSGPDARLLRPELLGFGLLMVLANGAVIWGAYHMFRIGSRAIVALGSAFAICSSILPVVMPTGGWDSCTPQIAVPTGVWALITLTRSDVRAAFR
jgi:hypothetical protein